MRQAERETFLSRLGRIEAAQRSVAGMMHLLFESSRVFGRERSSRFVGGWLRAFGPLTSEHKIGQANLAAAFPEMSARERREILSRVWDNLGRTTVEYAFLSDLVGAFDEARPSGGLIEHVGIEHAYAVRDSGKPAVIFGAHIGNWELTAAIGRKIGLPVTRALSGAVQSLCRRRRWSGGEASSSTSWSSPPAAPLYKSRVPCAAASMSGSSSTNASRRACRPPSSVGRPSPIRSSACSHGSSNARSSARSQSACRTAAIASRSRRRSNLPRDARGRVDADAVNRAVHGDRRAMGPRKPGPVAVAARPLARIGTAQPAVASRIPTLAK